MALQPIDRKKAKHDSRVVPRFAPPMVRRSNKSVLLDHAPRQVASSIDPTFESWRQRNDPSDWDDRMIANLNGVALPE